MSETTNPRDVISSVDIENQSSQPTPIIRRASRSNDGGDDSNNPMHNNNNSNNNNQPIRNQQRQNHQEETGRWHISSTFFNSANDIFYHYDARNHRGHNNNDSFPDIANDPQYDEKLSTYLDGIKAISYFPGYFCWIEKIILLFDFFQIFALIWISAQPWPWPYLWTVYTQPLVGFNLDFFSLTEDGALAGKTASFISRWGQMEHYTTNYALPYAILAFLYAAVLYIFHHYTSIFDSYGKAYYAYHSYIFGILLGLGYFLYIPFQLAVYRIYYCDEYNTTQQVAVDPTMNCMSTSHLIYMAIYAILTIPFSISIPYYFYYYTYKNITYYNSIDHEKKLQIYELLTMWNLSNDYYERQVWITSSFRYFGRYYYLHLLIVKDILLFLFLFLRSSYIVQSICIFLVIIAFSGYYCIYKLPYRNFLTNLQFITIISLWIMNISYGVCNAFQMTNLMTTSYVETVFLICVHTVFFAFIVILWGYILFRKRVKLDWPSVRTIDRIYHAPLLIPKVYYWLILLREIETIKYDYLLQSSEINNLPLIEYCIQQLRVYYLQAKSIGSIFESIISDYLEELLWIHSQKALFSYRRLTYWDQAYRESIQSRVWHRQRMKYKLMNPKKRRILFKLLSYFLLRGGNEYSNKFDLNIALEYQQNQRLQRELKLQRLKEIYYNKQKNRKNSNYKNQFKDFLKDFHTLMDDDSNDVLGNTNSSLSDQQHRKSSANDQDGWTESQKEKFQEEMKLEAKKMIDRLQQRTELALNKHHHAAKAINEQQKQQQLAAAVQQQQQQRSPPSIIPPNSPQLIQENSHNKSINNIIHHYNLAQQQQFQLGGGAASMVLSGGGSQVRLGGRSMITPLGGSSQSLVGGSNNTGLKKISTMELIKETVDEEERQDLEELYYLWDEAITLYENEEFPGNYEEELNQQVENWYAYRGLVSQRLEMVVKYLQEQFELLDDVIDQVVEEDDDNNNIEEGENENLDEEDIERQRASSILSRRNGLTGSSNNSSNNSRKMKTKNEEQQDLLSGSYVMKLKKKRQILLKKHREEEDDGGDDGDEEEQRDLLSGSYVMKLNKKKEEQSVEKEEEERDLLSGSYVMKLRGKQNAPILIGGGNQPSNSTGPKRNRNALSRTYQLQQQQRLQQQADSPPGADIGGAFSSFRSIQKEL